MVSATTITAVPANAAAAEITATAKIAKTAVIEATEVVATAAAGATDRGEAGEGFAPFSGRSREPVDDIR
jgi:hypothetical protein